MSEWKPSACILCELICGIEVQKGEGNIITKVKGDKNHPGSQGYICNKAGRLSHYQNGTDRILEPLRRKADGSFETISWDTAISEIAEKMQGVKDQYGGDKILYLSGGQGNHISGPYAASFRSTLGSIYKSNPIAQEKTGEMWVANQMFNSTGGVQRGDCENADVAIYLGKNPYHTHGFHQCRKKLQKLKKDENHKIVVVDPRRTESADIADMHLAVKNGTDAWMMAALVAIVIQEDWVDHAWMKKHTIGFEEVYPFFFNIPVAEYCKQCGIEEDQLRELARWIHEAESVAVWEDLGVQMNRNSTLISYLQRLLLTITGNFGKKGAQFIALPLVNIVSPNYRDDRRTPVTNSRIIGGLIPCNVVSEEILADHPDRMRAVWINGSNAVHSYAGSKNMAEALRATDITVVVDIAMTETAMEADYVLPAPTQYEKAEMSMFQFEFPHNVAQLRHPVFDAPETVLHEAEIYARLCEALGAIPQEIIVDLNQALAKGEQAFGDAFFKVVSENPGLVKMVPVILYRTLGQVLPEGLAAGAGYMPFCIELAMKNPEAVKAAGHKGEGIELGMNLFRALIDSPSGVMLTHEEWDASFKRLGHPDQKIHLHLPEMIPELESLAEGFKPLTSPDYPFVLSCGERRDYTANGIYRDPAWRKVDYDCALRMSPSDAETLGLESGQLVRISTRQGEAQTVVEVNDRMRPGHISLPNGGGLQNNLNTEKAVQKIGAATNDLTSVDNRDFFAGTPWHKYVPANVELISA
ncbi:molybdopterin-dependent oxidoreductase [Maricurvus nonylphenolicus]|uniref:molybdopterin-dependent oxidoreductase n=1 Tax=Maricurvus nonylphenolicus TaxID=1008307 RepID=UPI0036F43129